MRRTAQIFQPRPHGHMSLLKKTFSSGETYGRGDEVANFQNLLSLRQSFDLYYFFWWLPKINIGANVTLRIGLVRTNDTVRLREVSFFRRCPL